jgi:hypothetical protein
MATARSTSRWRGQKISALQEKCSRRIRRRTATPKATFVVFLFRFHLFTMNVTRALPLEAIKEETGASDNREIKSTRVHYNQAITHHAPPLVRDLGSAPSLESL